MSYLYDKKKKRKKRGIIILAIVFCIFLFTPIVERLYDMFESPIAQAYKNAEITKRHLSLLVDTTMFSKFRLAEHNNFLQSEVNRLMVENARIDFLESELNQKLSESGISAHIIKRVIHDSHVIVDKGLGDGLSAGDRVFSNNVLLGEVSEAYDHSARIMLYTNKDSRQTATLFPQNVSVELQGYGNLGYYLEIDRFVEVAEGDVIYSESYPGYIMAIVRSVDFDARDPFKKVFLAPAVNINTIPSVQIMKKTTMSS